MADFDLGAMMDAGRGLIDDPPPGVVIDMHPGVVGEWLNDGTRATLAVQLVKTHPETRAAVPVVVLTSGLDRAIKALTAGAAGMKPGETPVTGREIRLAGYAVRLAAATRNLMANAPGGGFLSFGRSGRWDDAKAAANATLAELVELDTAPVGRLNLPERDAGRSTAAEQVDPRQVAGEYIAGRTPLLMPDVPLLQGHNPADRLSHAEAEAVLDELGIRPTLPAGYSYTDRPTGQDGCNGWRQTVRTWNGDTVTGWGDSPREAVADAVKAARAHHAGGGRVTAEDSFKVGPMGRQRDPKAAAFGLPPGYQFTGKAQGVHAPGPWTHYVDHVASGKRLYGHGATPDDARADAVRVAKNHAAAARDSDGADIVDALKMRFDAQIVFPDEVARRAVAEIERLRAALNRESDGMVQRNGAKVAAEVERDAARRHLEEYRQRVAGLVGKVPAALVIMSGNGGSVGPDTLDTLALTVANVVMMHDKANEYAADLAARLQGAESTADVLTREADGLRAAIRRESDAVGALRNELATARQTYAQTCGELATTRAFLRRREDEAAEFARRADVYRTTLVNVSDTLSAPWDDNRGGTLPQAVGSVRVYIRDALNRWPGPVGGVKGLQVNEATEATEAKAPASVPVSGELARERERADRMRQEAVFFGGRNAFYRGAMLAAHARLTKPSASGELAALDAIKILADALSPTAGPKRPGVGLGDRGPDLFGELLAYREAVADALTGLAAEYDRRGAVMPEPVRVAMETLRLVADLSATPRQMTRAADGESPVVRALEDAQAQLAALRAAVGVAGFGIVLLPGACVRLQDMRAEPAGDDGEGSSMDDSARTPDSVLNEADERDDREAELRADILKLSDRVAGLRVLLNFSELRCRAMGRLFNHERARETDAAAALLAAVDAMSRAVVATLTAAGRPVPGVMAASSFARAAAGAAGEVRLLIGERDHVSPEAYALPVGFSGP